MAVTGKSAKIERALRYRLGQLVLSPVRPIADAGQTFTPDVGLIYLDPRTLWNSPERAEIGTGAARRYLGIYQVGVRGPILGNPEPQTEVVDAIIEHFDRQVIDHESVLVRIGSFNGGRDVPFRGSAIIDDGWKLINVSVPFWCDVLPA